MSEASQEKIDFGALLDQHLNRLTTHLDVGDKVNGRVTHIDARTVYLDINATGEAMLDRVEMLDDAGQLTVKVGDTVEARVVSAEDGEIRLSRRANSGALADASLWDAYQAKIPVEGRVSAECKGGYEVMVGNTRGFCPYSQIDIYKHEPAVYLAQKFLFMVREYSENGRRLVLNRRFLLEAEQKKQREELKERLKVGDVLTGTVRRLQPFGVFVSLGGVDGLIPMSELSWKRGVKAEEIVKEGQDITVMIRDIDWEKERISLSLKFAQGDPWDKAEGKYVVGTEHTGTVTQIMPFGAFVELEAGIEGLIHISKLGNGRRIRSPDEVVKIGDTVEVTIDGTDREKRRISLAMVFKAPPVVEAPAVVVPAAPAVEGETKPVEEVVVGREVTGVVDSSRDFGIFVKLPNGRTGLLHISQLDLPDSPTRLRTMFNQYPAGKEVKVIVKSMEGERISLTLHAMLEKEDDSTHFQEYRKQQQPSATGLNTLGGLVDFSKLNLPKGE